MPHIPAPRTPRETPKLTPIGDLPPVSETPEKVVALLGSIAKSGHLCPFYPLGKRGKRVSYPSMEQKKIWDELE